MPRTTLSFDDVREIGRTLPGVEEGTAYRSPALRVRGRMFTCLAIHRSAEPDSLVVRLPFTRRNDLIRSDPDTYYVKPHYVSWPTLLVRLKRARRNELAGLLDESRQFIEEGKGIGPRRKRQKAATRTRSRRRTASTARRK